MTEAERALLLAIAAAVQVGQPDVKAALAKLIEEAEVKPRHSHRHG